MPADESSSPESMPALRAGPVSRVPVDLLVAGDSPRLTGENFKHVRALAESETVFLPIVVHEGTKRVIDGMHRLAAAKLRGQSVVDVVFVACDERDAFVLAVQSNIQHGLALTLTERKAAATRILGTHAQWSDRTIASVTGLSPTTVGGIRSRSTVRSAHSNKRRGMDGVERPLSAADGRSRAFELLRERPNASIREIAAMAGIAPSTVHDVRRRMCEGQEPVPAGRRKAGANVHLRLADSGRVDTGRDRVEVSVGKLGIDPVLRHTMDGRILLRLLSTHSVLERRIAQLVGIVPEHLADSIAVLARRTGDSWHDLSQQLSSAGAPRTSEIGRDASRSSLP